MDLLASLSLGTAVTAGETVAVVAAPDHVRAVRQHVFDPLTTTQAAALGRILREILAATSPDISEEVARRI